MKNDAARSKGMLALSMLIFGTIGVFRRCVALPSAVIALSRGIIGMLFLLTLTALRRERLSFSAIRANLPRLIVGGALLGLNWILLFEAYRFTSVAVATLCYYMAPVIVLLASPFVLKERLSARKLLCVLVALIGMALVTGVFGGGLARPNGANGILLGLGAAFAYACIVLLNQRMIGISANDQTIVQLGVSVIVILPYAIFSERMMPQSFTAFAVGMLLLMGVLHTGVAYALYFGSMSHASAQTVALFGYIDPIVAVVLSAFVLREELLPIQIVGAGLLLCATAASELPTRKTNKA